MKTRRPKWLSHLENSIYDDVKGYTISMYSLALEGWRRGLDLSFINNGRNKALIEFQLSDGNKTHKFLSSQGDLITDKARKTCLNKAKTKELLIKNNVPTPKGKYFSNDVKDKTILETAKNIGYPLVIKPVSGYGGQGVIANIKNQSELKEALWYLRGELGEKKIILERYFAGEDYRVYVLKDEVLGIIKRIPANVIGDGSSTIMELIREKNKRRKNSPVLGSSTIKIDDELKTKLKDYDLTLDSILTKGRQVFLKTKNNISAGGDPIDITDEVSDEIKQIAIKACNSIPGLPHAGVDLLVNEKGETVVLEVNARPSLRTHLFPEAGESRDIPKKVIDFYFPETRGKQNYSFYFDFGIVWSHFRQQASQTIKIPSIPEGPTASVAYKITGNIERKKIINWLRNKATDVQIHCNIKVLDEQKLYIVLGGPKKNIDKFRSIICTLSNNGINIYKLINTNSLNPIQIGFTVSNKIDKSSKNNKSDKDYKQNIKDKKSNELENLKYKKEYEKIIKSTSWKITKPIRILGKIIRRK